MKEYPIKHAVSFHGSIKRAEQFREYNDSFTQEFPSFGQLSTFHVSGQTPTGTRSNIIKQFAKADRSLVTNARCLTEGVDVPSIDCVLFADPKKSKVDIVQAVGRALRPAPGKKLGYVILPVLHDEDSGELKESGAFKEVIDMLATLASQDERIIDDFRAISQGRSPTGNCRVRFEFGERISASVDIEKFTSELQIKCWNRLAKLSWMPFIEARAFVRSFKLKKVGDWTEACKGKIPGIAKPADIPYEPNVIYKLDGWVSWPDWLGYDRIATNKRVYLPFLEAREFARSLNLKTSAEWIKFSRGLMPEIGIMPNTIPGTPSVVYEGEGWVGMADWLGLKKRVYMGKTAQACMPFESARSFVRTLGIKTRDEWVEYYKGNLKSLKPIPADIPHTPNKYYAKSGWKNWGDWLGTGFIHPRDREYLPFAEARRFARSLGLTTQSQWTAFTRGESGHLIKLPPNIPALPGQTYKNKGWINLGDWLGTGAVADRLRKYRDFKDARAFVHALKLKDRLEWRKYCKVKPDDIHSKPDFKYKGKGWKGWKDWLGDEAFKPAPRKWRDFISARAFVRSLQIRNQIEWNLYKSGGLPHLPALPKDIPKKPESVYEKEGWLNLPDWLGNGITPRPRGKRI